MLSEGTLNTVTTSSSLVFEVTIHNGGDSQEVQIPVTLTIARPHQQGGPITKTEKVQLIDPGTDQSVTFTDLGAGAVRVADHGDGRRGEGARGDKHREQPASYQVIFSLPS